MTARQCYEAILIELNKENAPNILLEDFNYLFNKAINQYINKRYNIYDISQQTTDDLRVLKATALLEPKKCKEYGVTSEIGRMMGATYEVVMPSDYLHILNCICIYDVNKTFKCYNKGDVWRRAATRLTADVYSQILDNFWLRPTYRRPYYYIHNINQSQPGSYVPYDNDEVNNTGDGSYYERGDGTITITKPTIPTNPYNEVAQTTKPANSPEFVANVDPEGALRYEYTDYPSGATGNGITGYVRHTYIRTYTPSQNEGEPGTWGQEEIESKVFKFGANSTGTDARSAVQVMATNTGTTLNLGVDAHGKNIVTGKGLPDQYMSDIGASSLVEKGAGLRYGNVSTVRMEIRYGTDDRLFRLKKVYIDYIKAPQNIRLTQEQLDVTEDTSQMLEFPDYVCQEIINELVHIVMENITDQRLQTHPVVSQSIANPAQAQAPEAAGQTA